MFFYNRHNITRTDIDYVKKSLKSNNITKGEFLNKFESQICKTFKSKYSLVTCNATSSFQIISKVLNWNKNSNIIVSPLTFVAGANSIKASGANPIFVDIQHKDQNLDPILVEKKIQSLKKRKKKIDAIIVTDYGGVPANWKMFFKLKKKYNIILINDNCHAMGSKYFNDRGYAVKYADIVIQSYHPVKNITSGEGGSILTNNKKIYLESKILREHGFVSSNLNNYWVREVLKPGFNARLSELNCALGFSQLKRLDKVVKERRRLAKFYDAYFSNHKYVLINKPDPKLFSSYHLYCLRINFKKLNIDKSQFHKFLKEKYKITLQVHYIPTYRFKLFQNRLNKENYKIIYPETEKYYNETFSIPLYLKLSKKNIIYICKAIDKVIDALK